jgi:3-deoxy-D-manno-octulosonic-acid transferase
MPRIIYTALFIALIPAYFIRLTWRGIGNKKYLQRWGERLGIANVRPTKDKSIVWVHAVSVGEVNASIPLLRALMEEYPGSEFLVTTSTPTGSDILLSKLGNKIKHQYVPIDIPFCINLFINTWKPKALILLETEIWPNIIHCCKRQGIVTALVNARLSEKSKLKYLRFNSVIQPAINSLDLILAQYESDAYRFNEIAADKEIKLCGNLKFDQDMPEELESISDSIRDSWSKEGKRRPTLIAASTHEGEEVIVLDAFNAILETITDALLIVVPRHLERFNKVKSLIDDQGFNFSSRSKKEDVTNDVQVLLGDTMGELNFLYSVSDVAFVGGSLIDHGGQNLLEPAAQGLPLCSGPSVRNFIEISDQLKKASGLTIIKDKKELADYFIDLVNDEHNLQKTGQASKNVFMENRGAIEIIKKDLDSRINKVL